MNHLGTKVLETDRLILRPLTLEDAPAMFENWANDSEVTKYLMWPPHENVEATTMLLQDWVSNYSKEDFYQWAITFKKDVNNPIGTISVVKQEDANKMVHIGYCIGKEWWKQGVTSEALERVITFFFDEVKVNRIESRHDSKNPNSGKVMLRCGMQHEGTLREADHNQQGLCDAVMYGILAKDYYQ